MIIKACEGLRNLAENEFEEQSILWESDSKRHEEIRGAERVSIPCFLFGRDLGGRKGTSIFRHGQR